METKLMNARELPEVFYGLHMVEGVAEYRPKGKDPYRVLIRNEAIKAMDPSFAGRPVYVRHANAEQIENFEETADGYVVESFFNPMDGKHWTKFLAISDAAKDAIKNKKWKLSNCYDIKDTRGGGQWNGVSYVREVTKGEYEHLAIVPNPRYDSMILTPEEFKAYNDNKQIELKKLANEKEEVKEVKPKQERKGMLNFFKRAKVENSADLEGVSVLLPRSGKEVSIEVLVKNADEMEMSQMANGDHHVMVGEEKMSVNSLVEKHKQCMNELADLKKPKENAVPAEDEAAKKKALELAAHEQAEIDKNKNNNQPEKKDAVEEKKENSMDNFNKLKNAADNAPKPVRKIELSEDRVARGKSRYGSN